MPGEVSGTIMLVLVSIVPVGPRIVFVDCVRTTEWKKENVVAVARPTLRPVEAGLCLFALCKQVQNVPLIAAITAGCLMIVDAAVGTQVGSLFGVNVLPPTLLASD